MRARVLVISIAGALVFAGATLGAQQPPRLPSTAAPRAAVRIAPPTRGIWVRGPGTYTVTVCEDGCTISGPPGKSVAMLLEAWGGGGGGASGTSFTRAGGGGGGGGYAASNREVLVPQTGMTTLQVTVGSGGTPGLMLYGYSSQAGHDGGTSQVVGHVEALGGKGGGILTVTAGGAGGAATMGYGIGRILQPGLSGGVGADPDTCNGGGGGAGGIGGGPEAIGNGGNGGHGSYQHRVILGKSCTAHGTGYGRTDGSAGGHGRVRITW